MELFKNYIERRREKKGGQLPSGVYFFSGAATSEAYSRLDQTDVAFRVNYKANTITVHLPTGYDIIDFMDTVGSVKGMNLMRKNDFGAVAKVSPEELKRMMSLVNNGGKDSVTNLFSSDF